jgi:hypothetical protein
MRMTRSTPSKTREIFSWERSSSKTSALRPVTALRRYSVTTTISPYHCCHRRQGLPRSRPGAFIATQLSGYPIFICFDDGLASPNVTDNTKATRSRRGGSAGASGCEEAWEWLEPRNQKFNAGFLMLRERNPATSCLAWASSSFARQRAARVPHSTLPAAASSGKAQRIARELLRRSALGL